MRSGFDAERALSPRHGDPILLATVLLLTSCGIAALWSGSAGYALSVHKPAYYLAVRQLFFLCPSVLLFFVCSAVDLETLRSKMGLITLIGFIILIPPFFFEPRNGARRWIDFGFATFQPSEIWKAIVVLYLAHILDRRAARIEESSGVLIPPFLIVALGILIVFLQNDFSTAVVIGASAVVVFWISGAPLSFFLGLAAAATPLAALSVLTSDFRLKRILAFWFPDYEPHGQGYQVLGSLRAIRSGGLFGKGFGLGTLKLASIPEVQSDFILAAWAEETGLLGVLAIFAAWCILAWRAIAIALREEDRFRSYLGFGMIALLLMEVLVNASVVSGLVPATGMSLPFFSQGGSSLLSTAISCGILYNLSRSPSISGPSPRHTGRPSPRSAERGEERPYAGAGVTEGGFDV